MLNQQFSPGQQSPVTITSHSRIYDLMATMNTTSYKRGHRRGKTEGLHALPEYTLPYKLLKMWGNGQQKKWCEAGLQLLSDSVPIQTVA
ncbi:unnamed protein product, partial [Boreogadus saida]